MTKLLKPLEKITIGVMKKRARSAATRMLQEAYEAAHLRYGLNRKQFAERIGMSPSEFSRILNGNQNITFELAEAILRGMERRLSIGSEDLDELTSVASNRVPPTAATVAQVDVVLKAAPRPSAEGVATKVELFLE